MTSVFKIGDTHLGRNDCYIIAEAGVNHNGDITLAHKLIDEAHAAGANAVKFQTFEPERLASPVAEKAAYQKETTGADESQLAMLKKVALRPEQYAELKTHCEDMGILFLSTPFDELSADLLENLDIAAFKIPSGEVTNLNFLRHVARKGRPIILSTGMSTLDEVAKAVAAIRDNGAPPLVLLHCSTSYPTEMEHVNLRAMQTMQDAFDVPIGYSDHTVGVTVAVGAVAMGATIIEKHFTLDKELPGPDHRASLEPNELKEMITAIRQISVALGDGVKQPQVCELNAIETVRKSVTAIQNLNAGTVIDKKMLTIMRPGTGIKPDQIDQLIGKKLLKNISAGAPLSWRHFE